MQFEFAGNSTSFELQNLLPGENYEVTLEARNIAGGNSSALNFTQPPSGRCSVCIEPQDGDC